MIRRMYGTAQISRDRIGVKIMSMRSGMRERIFFSTKDRRSTPNITARTPPYPTCRTEVSGALSFDRPRIEAMSLMPSSEVIMPSIPPRIGVAPKRSAAR